MKTIKSAKPITHCHTVARDHGPELSKGESSDPQGKVYRSFNELGALSEKADFQNAEYVSGIISVSQS